MALLLPLFATQTRPENGPLSVYKFFKLPFDVYNPLPKKVQVDDWAALSATHLRHGSCSNRPFAQLKKRAKGNEYDYGIEAMETEGKGYGVRAMRCFEPHQILVEFAGEIINQDECKKRKQQINNRDKGHYLMSFHNKMIIDATRGTIARFQPEGLPKNQLFLQTRAVSAKLIMCTLSIWIRGGAYQC
ncbi:hypothetical protein DM02DRAFT_664367 [Periconia macrospinosa]|uniref:SET domain-containing protein n=1 Tax=Periconia macrospinosa TaxID=97972 RepID=A0A2V1CZ89_9PLEO|nr:hypothetical protein DM02DRAFT_664367 [Periconia macrospinosa]